MSTEKYNWKKPKPLEKWIIDFISVHGDRYIYPQQQEVKNGHTKIKIICKEHGEFLQTPSKHRQGKGCRKCSYEKRGIDKSNTKEEWLEEIYKHHEVGKYHYPKVFPKNGREKMAIICKVHGVFYQNLNKHAITGRGCPSCRESHGERTIVKILEHNGIKYERQKKFDDCKNVLPLSFDFFLPDFNTLIEYDGQQHFACKKYWGGEDTLLKIQLRDKIKTEWVSSHPDFKLLRIRYDEDVSSRLHQFLQGVQHTDASTALVEDEVSTLESDMPTDAIGG